MNFNKRETDKNLGTARWLMAVSVVFTAVIVVYAVMANYNSQQARENALKDHIHFASWVYNQAIENSLNQSARQTLGAMGQNLEMGPEHQLKLNTTPEKINARFSEDESHCNNNNLAPVNAVFLQNQKTGKLHYYQDGGNTTGQDFEKWLQSELYNNDLIRRGIQYQLHSASEEKDQLIVYVHSSELPLQDADFIMGFKTDAGNLGNLFESIWQQEQLLPASVSKNQPNDQLMQVQIKTSSGQNLFESGNFSEGKVSVRDALGDSYSFFTGDLSIREDDSPLLAGGGLSSSNLALFTIFLLSVGLGVVSFIQLRSEADLNRMRSDFISNVSHELRTPVTQIRMFSETLLNNRTRNREERKKSLEIIEKESKRMTHLVSNILDFSKRNRDTLQISPDKISADQLIEEAVETFQPIAGAEDAAIEVDTEPVTAFLDPSAFRQIVINVLDNAIKYGPRGQTVQVKLKKAGEIFFVSISDEGPGIPVEDQEKIWKPYERGDGAGRKSATGSGIGLAVVHQYLELMDATVKVVNLEERGAEFRFEFPVNNNPEEHESGD